MKLIFTSNNQSINIPRVRDISCEGAFQFISGTATVVIEGSLDDSDYKAIGLAAAATDVLAANASAAGLFHFNASVYPFLRARTTAWTNECICRVEIAAA